MLPFSFLLDHSSFSLRLHVLNKCWAASVKLRWMGSLCSLFIVRTGSPLILSTINYCESLILSTINYCESLILSTIDYCESFSPTIDYHSSVLLGASHCRKFNSQVRSKNWTCYFSYLHSSCSILASFLLLIPSHMSTHSATAFLRVPFLTSC